jgi:SAM-dependent methyltransferase
MSQDPGFDPARFKAAARDQWDHAARGWHEQAPYIRAWLEPATALMLELAGIGPGARVLDVAAGAGDQSLDIARRVGADGRVVATDLSPAILAFARENARSAGLANIETQVADGEALGVDDASFDAAVCRLGLMLFADPLCGLRQMHRALRPGGRACAVVFSEPAANPCVGIVVSTALRHAGLPPPDPYRPGGLLSLGRPGLLDELFARAGFADVRTTKLAATFHMPSVREYMAFIRSSTGPILQILSRLDDAARNDAWADIEGRLGAYQVEGGWEGPNELLLTAGSR